MKDCGMKHSAKKFNEPTIKITPKIEKNESDSYHILLRSVSYAYRIKVTHST